MRAFFFALVFSMVGPFSVLALGAPTRIAAGGTHNCLLRATGELYCWGEANQGALGFGDVKPKTLPTAHPKSEAKSIRDVVAGVGITCAIYEDDQAKCWGQNNFGQLGLGSDSPAIGGAFNQAMARLPKIDLGKNRRVQKLAVKNAHACALLDGGEIKCWGQNSAGQLGQGDINIRGRSEETMGEGLRSIDLGKNRKAVDVCTGLAHTCVVLEDGKVACWGGGQTLGQGDAASRGNLAAHMGAGLRITDLGSGMKATQVTCGNESTCALLEDGRLKCWGRNLQGVLGAESALTVIGNTPSHMGDKLAPVSLSEGLRARDVSCGGTHCCAVLENSTLKCWGLNNLGQLGIGSTATRGLAKDTMGENLPFVDLGKLAEVRSVSCGQGHTCVVLGNDEVKCWGSGGNGGYNLGNGKPGTLGISPAHMGANLPSVKLPKAE